MQEGTFVYAAPFPPDSRTVPTEPLYPIAPHQINIPGPSLAEQLRQAAEKAHALIGRAVEKAAMQEGSGTKEVEWSGTSIEEDLNEAERLFGCAIRRIRNAIAKHRAKEGVE